MFLEMPIFPPSPPAPKEMLMINYFIEGDPFAFNDGIWVILLFWEVLCAWHVLEPLCCWTAERLHTLSGVNSLTWARNSISLISRGKKRLEIPRLYGYILPLNLNLIHHILLFWRVWMPLCCGICSVIKFFLLWACEFRCLLWFCAGQYTSCYILKRIALVNSSWFTCQPHHHVDPPQKNTHTLFSPLYCRHYSVKRVHS